MRYTPSDDEILNKNNLLEMDLYFGEADTWISIKTL